jgi:hypothetical protein
LIFYNVSFSKVSQTFIKSFKTSAGINILFFKIKNSQFVVLIKTS